MPPYQVVIPGVALAMLVVVAVLAVAARTTRALRRWRAVAALGVIGSAAVLRRLRPELFVGVALAAMGIGLFAAYMLFTLIVTTAEGRNPGYQAPIELVVLPLATLAALLGALMSVIALVREGRSAIT